MARFVTIIHTVLGYSLGRARLISLKTPAMLMNAVVYKMSDKSVMASHT